MALQKRVTTVATADGVGRKDYSQNVEYSVEKAIRSLQQRFFYSYSYTDLPALVFPDVYETRLQFLVDGALQNVAPSTEPWMIYLAEVTTNTNNLVVVTLNRYLTEDAYTDGDIYEHLGTAFGFVEAKLEFTKGIPTQAGSIYSLQLGEFSGGAFDLDVVVHGLIGGQEELE